MKVLFYILCCLFTFPLISVATEQPPAICRIKTLEVVPADKTISLHWQKPAENTCKKIIIYRKSGINMADRNHKSMDEYQTLSKDTDSFIDKSVKPGLLYFYSIGGLSSEKKECIKSPVRVGIIKDLTPPESVSKVQAKIDKQSIITVQWKPAKEPDVVSYQIYRGVEKLSTLQPVAIVSKNEAPIFKDKVDPLSPFAFIYVVSAIDSSGNEGPMSLPTSIEVPDKRAPEKPFMTSLHPDRHKISLSWSPSPSPDVVGYNVYRSTDNWKTRLKLNKELITLPGYADREIKFGVKYSYYVTAVDKAGNESKDSGDYSCRSIVEDKIVAPEALKLRKNKLNTPQLHWKIMGNEVRGYLVERRPGGAKDFRQVSGLLKENIFVDTDKTSDIEIEYRLRALYKNGQISPPSDPVLWKASRKQEREKL